MQGRVRLDSPSGQMLPPSQVLWDTDTPSSQVTLQSPHSDHEDQVPLKWEKYTEERTNLQKVLSKFRKRFVSPNTVTSLTQNNSVFWALKPWTTLIEACNLHARKV